MSTNQNELQIDRLQNTLTMDSYLELLTKGHTVNEIANMYGYTTNKMIHWRKVNNVYIKSKAELLRGYGLI